MGLPRTSRYDARTSEYKNEYIKEKYDRINLTLPKGSKEQVAIYCKEHGFRSVNDFIGEAIQTAISFQMSKAEDGSIFYPDKNNVPLQK